MNVREATEGELADWDTHTVDPPGGHVLQSVAWARHRAASGWQPLHLVLGDGARVLGLRRLWPLLRGPVAGASAYVPRGPIPRDITATAGEAVAVAEWLASRGVDVVAVDPEVSADTPYGAAMAQAGFRQIEEIQPSRHRVGLPLRGADEDGVLAAVAKSTRQRIRRAERDETVVVRHDSRAGDDVGDGFAGPAEGTRAALDRFYDLLLETGERRHFAFGPRRRYLAWWKAAHAAGHLILLEARAGSPTGDVLGGLVLYRHGDRLSTVHSGDPADRRRSHPGTMHLLRWRAIQLAIREGRAEMDLGGVDVAGARRKPHEGEPLYGLLEHKLSFGAEWIELAGAHERVIRPWRYALGRATGRLARVTHRHLR